MSSYDDIKETALAYLTPVKGSMVWQGTEHWVVDWVKDGRVRLMGQSYGLIVEVCELWPLREHELRPIPGLGHVLENGDFHYRIRYRICPGIGF